MKMFIGLLAVALTSVSSVYGDYGVSCNKIQTESLIPQEICLNPFKSYCCIDITRWTNSGKISFWCCGKADVDRHFTLAIFIAIGAIVVIVICCVLCVACLRCTFCPAYNHDRNPGPTYVQVNKPSNTV